jgi:hypothetical protein
MNRPKTKDVEDTLMVSQTLKERNHLTSTSHGGETNYNLNVASARRELTIMAYSTDKTEGHCVNDSHEPDDFNQNNRQKSSSLYFKGGSDSDEDR